MRACVFTFMRECMVYLQVLRAHQADHEDQSDPKDEQKQILGAFVTCHVTGCCFLVLRTLVLSNK